jgi:hypothetical protein
LPTHNPPHMNNSTNWQLQKQNHMNCLEQATCPHLREMHSNHIFICELMLKKEEKERVRIEEARKRMDARLALIEKEREEEERRLESKALMAQLRCAKERNCLSQPETRGDEWFFAGVRVVARAATGLWQK